MKLASIIIVNWNGLRWLRGCLPTIFAQDYDNIDVIVVDNASLDGSASWVRDHHPSVTVIENKINEGYAEANNIGFRCSKGDYVVFLNNDTLVTPGFLTKLVETVESSDDIGGVQSKILLMSEQDTLDSVGAFLTNTGFLFHYGFGDKDHPDYDKEIDLYTAKGACMLFKRNVLNAIAVEGSVFDPEYFAYFEETDMCHRVWLAGYRIVYAHKSLIFHEMSATSREMSSAFIQYHSFKNRIRSYLKNLGLARLSIILPIHIALCQGLTVVSLLRGKFALGVALQRALWWNVVHLPHTIKQRRFIQKKIRAREDRAFLGKIMVRPSLRYYFRLYRRVA